MLLTSVLIVGAVSYAGISTYRHIPPKKKLWISYAEKIRVPLETIYNRCSGHILSSEDNSIISEADKKNNTNLAISLTSLGLSAAGPLIYSPLSVISAIGLFYVSIPFFCSAYTMIFKNHKINVSIIDSLLACGCIVSGNYFAYALSCSLVYGGRKILSKTEDHSRKDILNVFELQTDTVWLYSNGSEIETTVDSLIPGDIIVVHAGETIPVDGIIKKGDAVIDQHVLTGESQPAEKYIGDLVFASTILTAGQLFIAVKKAGKETSAAKITQILAQTADFKSSLQTRGEIYVDQGVLPTLSLAILAWTTIGSIAALTILNACFAYYMRVLGPMGMLNFLKRSAQSKILIKDGRVLDILTKIDTIVFDKTGTLTLAQPHVGNIHACSDYKACDILTYAAAAEYKQSHPVALAILAEAKIQQLMIPEIDATEYKVGYGIIVKLSGKTIYVGSARFMGMEGIDIPQKIQAMQQQSAYEAHSLIMVAINKKLVGVIELVPTVRPEAKDIIRQLRARHIKSMYIISGDHEGPTKQLAKELSIEHYFSETLPEQKAELIEQLQKEGKFVCYIGDGINDSIALKKAHVSISMHGASAIAMDTAQVILMSGNLEQIVELFDLAKKFDKNMKRTLMISLIPGCFTVGGAFFLHFTILHTIILNQIGFIGGFLSSMMPPKKYKQRKGDVIELQSGK